MTPSARRFRSGAPDGDRIESRCMPPGCDFACPPLLVGKPFDTGKVIDFELARLIVTHDRRIDM